MTADELDHEMRSLITDVAKKAPGVRHVHLPRLHGVMAEFSRSGRAAPPVLRRLLEEMTDETISRSM